MLGGGLGLGVGVQLGVNAHSNTQAHTNAYGNAGTNANAYGQGGQEAQGGFGAQGSERREDWEAATLQRRTRNAQTSKPTSEPWILRWQEQPWCGCRTRWCRARSSFTVSTWTERCVR